MRGKVNDMAAADSLRELPAPLRIGALVFLSVFVLSCVSLTVLLGQGSADHSLIVVLLVGSIGIAAMGLGMTLATDFRGSAWEYARLSKTLGPDTGSRFLFRFLRVCGGTFVVGGACFVALAIMIALTPDT